MKSRVVSSTQRLVLSYGVSGDELDTLVGVSKGYGADVRLVMPSELDTKVKNLLKVSKLNLETYPQGVERLILMCGFDRATMGAYLDTLKSKGVNIPLRAMLTPTNQHWNFAELLSNVSAEHRTIND